MVPVPCTQTKAVIVEITSLRIKGQVSRDEEKGKEEKKEGHIDTQYNMGASNAELFCPSGLV